MIRVKICGITNLQDALLASELGAYALGFVFYKKSKRFVDPNRVKRIIDKLPTFILKVGIFVEEEKERIMELKEKLPLDRVQLYEKIPEIEKNIVIKAIRVRVKEDLKEVERTPFFPLLDTYTEEYGGSGKSFDWKFLEGIKRPYILAGGINLENLHEVMRIKPYAIDIATGVEKEPGKKDEKMMKELFERIRKYEK